LLARAAGGVAVRRGRFQRRVHRGGGAVRADAGGGVRARKTWGLWVALALQAAMVVCAVVHPAIGIMGAIFAAIWGYILYLRRDVARRMQAGQLYDQLGHPPGYPPEEQG